MEKENRYSIQIILNLSLIAFSVVAILEYNLKKLSVNKYHVKYLTFIYVAIITLACIYALCVIDDKLQKSNSKKLRVLNLILLVMICVCVIMLTGGSDSRYKYLFILPVISSTIEGDRAYGKTVSAISTLFLFISDAISSSNLLETNCFENDLTLSCVFFVITYSISYCISDKQKHISILQMQMLKDELTKLNNFRSFDEKLAQYFKLSKKDNRQMSLALMDIDWFKDYNDTYGHNKGNELLKSVGKMMVDSFPDNFILSRYGGDEFVIIMPDTDIDKAYEYAEKFRIMFSKHSFEGNYYLPHGRLTISIGLASITPEVNEPSKLLNNADEALYRAKFARRNTTEKYVSFADEFNVLTKAFNSELDATINTLFAVISSKEKYTPSHCKRVYYICDGFSDYLKLDRNDKKTLMTAAYLHDIGKINISKSTLLKTSALTDEELEEIRMHPVVGEKLLLSASGLETESKIVRQHHERYDGKGYPDHLSGTNINYLARILGIVDSYDAMTNKRPYKFPKSVAEAKREILRCAGSQFDPELAKKFVDYMSSVE